MKHGRRFVLKFGGTTNGALAHPPTAIGRTCWGGCGRGSPPPATGVRGYYPRKFLKITVQHRAILCKIGQYLCRKSTAKVVLISDILLADKADSQPNKRELNFNCLQLQHSYVQSHPRLSRLGETAHPMQRVHLQYCIYPSIYLLKFEASDRLCAPWSQKALTLYPATDCTAATDISGVSSRWQLSR